MKINGEKSHNFDAVVIGAGVAGLYQLHLLRKLGFSVKALKKEPTSEALGIGIDILDADSTQKATPTTIPFLMNY